MLSAEQQERYSRHLLLEEFDQEKLLAAAVHVAGTGAAAHWAARYLAASGVGRIAIDEPAWEAELRALGPWLEIAREAPRRIEPQGGALEGARAALELVRELAGT